MKLDLKKAREFGSIELLARQLVEGFITGLHKSPFHGFSVEFAEHRLYNNGESTRHVDWKVFAKTDKLFTKRYEEETNLRCHLVIDASPSMYYPDKDFGKIAFSTLAAAALANLMQRQRDAVGLSVYSEEIELQTQVKSTPGHMHLLYAELDKLLHSSPSQKGTKSADILHLLADKFPKRSLVVIFSDMFSNSSETEDLFAALQHLKHNKHEVILFHVTEPTTERDFVFDERPYEFIDIESGKSVKAHPSQVKDVYTKTMKEFYEDLHLKCGKLKIDFIETDINKGFNPIFMEFLKRRAKMRV